MLTKSDSIKSISEALLKFHSLVKPVGKTSSNPFFKSKYADIASILEAIKGPLGETGLSFVQFPSGEGGLTTVLMHVSGEWIEETFFMKPVDSKPQTYGSMITYMRRYALSAILGIATEEDDDGNAASYLDSFKRGEPFPSDGSKKKGKPTAEVPSDEGAVIDLSVEED